MRQFLDEQIEVITEFYILLIAVVIVFVFILVEQLIRTKKDGLDKLGIFGLSMSIIGIIVVILSSFFE